MDEQQRGAWSAAEPAPQGEVVGQWPVRGIDEEPTMAWTPTPEPDDDGDDLPAA